MKLNAYLDVDSLRRCRTDCQYTVKNATVPVLETGTGNCQSSSVDKDADTAKVIPIIINAKTQRTSVCNACESVLIHKDISDSFTGASCATAHLCKNSAWIPTYALWDTDCIPATEEDYASEYLNLEISIKTVSTLEEAITHTLIPINYYYITVKQSFPRITHRLKDF